MAESAGYEIVGRIEQVRQPDPRYQIGPGKVEELAELVKKNEAEKVIFDNPLRPLQAYNLAKATDVEAIDRFQLILEIFTRRATTTEANLQIRLAKLNYNLAQAKDPGQFGQSRDNFVWIPVQTYFKMYGARRGFSITATAVDHAHYQQAQDEVGTQEHELFGGKDVGGGLIGEVQRIDEDEEPQRPALAALQVAQDRVDRGYRPKDDEGLVAGIAAVVEQVRRDEDHDARGQRPPAA